MLWSFVDWIKGRYWKVLATRVLYQYACVGVITKEQFLNISQSLDWGIAKDKWKLLNKILSYDNPVVVPADLLGECVDYFQMIFDERRLPVNVGREEYLYQLAELKERCQLYYERREH